MNSVNYFLAAWIEGWPWPFQAYGLIYCSIFKKQEWLFLSILLRAIGNDVIL